MRPLAFLAALCLSACSQYQDQRLLNAQRAPFVQHERGYAPAYEPYDRQSVQVLAEPTSQPGMRVLRQGESATCQ